MEKLLRLPLWALAVFTQSKSFRDNPVIGSPALNRAGLHAARAICSDGVTHARRLLMHAPLPAEDRLALDRDGYFVRQNYLPAPEFQRLRGEIEGCSGAFRECAQGDTLTQRILLNATVLESMPVCRTLLNSQPLLNAMRYTGGTYSYPLYFLQRIRNRVRTNQAPDPQRNLHSDTFHPTAKCWLFLCDVDERNGPFTYVPGSHRLSWLRLKWEYALSSRGRELNDRYSEKGSLRIELEDLAGLGLPDPVSLSVPMNTLVVANTHGFHCRGDALAQTERTEIYGSLRTNPFNPLPGVDLKWLRTVKYRLVDMYFRHQDRKAAERGVQATWHHVDPDRNRRS